MCTSESIESMIQTRINQQTLYQMKKIATLITKEKLSSRFAEEPVIERKQEMRHTSMYNNCVISFSLSSLASIPTCFTVNYERTC